MSVMQTRLSARAGSEQPRAVPPNGYRRRVRATPAGTWSRESVLVALQDWTRARGSAPRAEDWSPAALAESCEARASTDLVQLPCLTTVRRYFGSWSAALEAAGLRNARLAPWELSLAERVETARRLSARGVKTSEVAREIGVSAGTVQIYLRASVCPGCGGPLVTASARRCRGCDARTRTVRWAESEVRAARRAWAADRAAVVAALRELAVVTGRRPVWSDLHPRRQGRPSYAKVVALFGSFSAALAAADFRPRGRKWTRDEVVSALRAWAGLHGRVPVCTDWLHTTQEHPGSRAVAALFGSWSAALYAAGLRTAWSRDQILAAFRAWTEEHGCLPTSREWQSADARGRRPTTERVRREFGTWSAALAAASRATRRGRRNLGTRARGRPRGLAA
jgi:hypothetical protein